MQVHNMLALMLDPRIESLKLISSFLGHEHGVAIINKYDKKKKIVSHVLKVLSTFVAIVSD
jgi:hypothetical protein